MSEEIIKAAEKKSKETFAYSLSKDVQEGATGSVSVALVTNIAARRTALPPLFPPGSKQAKLLAEMEAIDEARLVDRKDKPTYLTLKDMKYIYALSHFLSLIKDTQEVQEYVRMLSEEQRLPFSRIVLPIDVTSFTKFVQIDGKARKRQKEETLREFERLSTIKQVQSFGKGDKVLRFVQPLISVQEKLIDATEGKVLDIDVVNVQLGFSFFYELYNRYAIIKPSLFKVWGKKGSGADTELFGILLSNLLAKYSGHRIASIRDTKSLNKKDFKTDDSYFKARKKAEKEALTYSEYLDTIKERVTTDYDSSREQKKRFTKDLTNALEILKSEDIRLITEYSITSEKKGERLNVVFNPDYYKREEGIIISSDKSSQESKQLPPPAGDKLSDLFS